MWILDIFSKKSNLTTSFGVTGTDLQSGMITDEYNTDLQFPESIRVYDEMRKSDGTTIAILRAIKQPLISAKWQIQSGWEEAKDKEIADFITHNLFEKVKFKHFLRESLGFLDFGFYYFEKVYEIIDGKIEWKDMSPRMPKAHYLWSMWGNEWVNGHPTGITQQVNTNDEAKWFTREIPWEKLVLFSYEREGNNFEGVSILRNAYKHYFYKDLLYKVSSISSERYGVGIPSAQVKSSTSDKAKSAIDKALKNIRSNEQSYISYTEDVVKLEILTPNGSGVGTQIEQGISHHDKKIYDSILAGFLNLTSGEGGSNALSKDQSSFFLRGLQGIADFWIDTMNEHIRELVDLNYNGVENYPKLTVSDIGSISMDEQINAIGSAVEKGLLDITQDDKNMIRDVLKMPRLTQEQIKEIESEKKAQAIDQKSIDEKAKQDAITEQAKKKDKNLSESLKPTKRENTFTKNITSFEQYLNKKFTECEKIVKESEKEYQKVLTELYESSDTQRIDGVVCLIYDKAKVTSGKNKAQKITDKLEAKLIGSTLQDEIFTEALAQANGTLDDNEKLLAYKAEIKKWQIDTFIEGYVSNMQGVIYNEWRRVLENITLNYGSEASLDLAKKTAEVSINKNILSLSFITHPRALYKFVVYNEAQAQWFTMFKTLVPTDKIPNVIDRPFGMTASFLFTIQTAAQINKLASTATAWKTAEAVTGLGLHHGSFEYYYPIASSELDIEQEIARIQREELQKEIDNQQ